MCIWALPPCMALLSLIAAVLLVLSSLLSVRVDPPGRLGAGCAAALCCWLTVATAGAVCPGMAASKMVTVKIAPTTIAACANKLTAELRTDIAFSSDLLSGALLHSFHAAQFISPIYDT